MPTSNNKNILIRTQFQNGILEYNLPLEIYSAEGEIQSLVRIQPYKINDLGLFEKVGNQLIQDESFSVAINNTINGVIITFFNTILDATHFEVVRYTDPTTTTEYQSNLNSVSLKTQLDTDITNAFNVLQEHEKSIQSITTDVSTYSQIIGNQQDDIDTLKSDLITHTHDATTIAFNPTPDNKATNIQQAIENNENAIFEIASGLTPRPNVLVASQTNVDLLSETTIDGVSLALNDRVLIKEQTNLAENGIYIFNGTSLERSVAMNTLVKIQGSKVQVDGGTDSKNIYYFTIDNIQGVLGTEPIYVERQFSPISDNQITLQKIDEQPGETILGNINPTTGNIQAISKNDLKAFLGIDNIDNTSDIDKPISTATQTELDSKVSQTDFDNLNSYVTQADQDLLTAIGNKQDILTIGSETQFLGFQGSEIVAKDFTKSLLGLENVNNTSDAEKPISNASKIEFDKTVSIRGNILNYIQGVPTIDIFTLINGLYYIPSQVSININSLPNNLKGINCGLIIFNIFDESSLVAQLQTVYDLSDLNNVSYHRVGKLSNNSFSIWSSYATSDELSSAVSQLNATIQNITSGQLTDIYVTLSQYNVGLSGKEDIIPAGTSTQYFTGDKTFAELTTDVVPEGVNQSRLYHSSARVRGTTINGYTPNNSSATTSADTILEALGKKLDAVDLKQATESQQGTLQIATQAEVNTGTNDTKALTIAKLKNSNILVGEIGEIKTIARQSLADFPASVGAGTWIHCDGRALSTTAYPKLFAVLGYTYGGSGASFNIPDLRERVVAGASSNEPINKKEVAKTHTLIEAEMPSHSHPLLPTGNIQSRAGINGNGGGALTGLVQTTIGPTGGDQPHNNMQPTIYLPYFIFGA